MSKSGIIPALLGLAFFSACLTGTGPTAATEEGGTTVREEALSPTIPVDPPDLAPVAPPPTPISRDLPGGPPLAMNPPGGITPREDTDWIEIVFSAWRAVYGPEFSKTMASDQPPESIAMPVSGELDLAYLVEGRVEKADGPQWVHASEGSTVRIVLHVSEAVRRPEDPAYTSCKAMLIENASPNGHNLFVPHLAVQAGEMFFYLTPLLVLDTEDCSRGLTAATEEAVDAFVHAPTVHPLGSLQILPGAMLKRDRRPDLIPGPILVPVVEPPFKVGP